MKVGFIMIEDKKFKKLVNNIERQINKFKINEIEINEKSFRISFPLKNCNDTIEVVNMQTLFNIKRINIIKTLIEINYKRGNSKWTPTIIVGFLEEIMAFLSENTFYTIINNNLVTYKFSGDNYKQDNNYKKFLLSLSERYNVPVNRFNTQFALFFNNFKKGKSKCNILEYFSLYELLKFYYRDIEKLQKNIENNKINEIDLLYLKEYGIIE